MKEASHSIGWLASLTASNTQQTLNVIYTESYVTSYTNEFFDPSGRITQDEIEEYRKEIADLVWGDFMKAEKESFFRQWLQSMHCFLGRCHK